MADKKEKPTYEKIMNDINSTQEKMTPYIWALKHEHDTMLSSTRDQFISKMGADKAYEHLKTDKGKREFSDISFNMLQDLTVQRYGLDKSKIHEFDFSRAVESTYGLNKNATLEIANRGPDFDFADYKSGFLNKHLEQVQSSITQNHLMNFDSKEIPNIAKKIGMGKYLDNVNILNDNAYKGSIAQAVINWDKGKNPIGVNYIKQDSALNTLLKKEYKN